MKTIEEKNKMIAEFMGLELEETLSGKMVYARHECTNPNKENDCKTEFYEANELLYHFSFDWLMPVVEKIEKTNDGTIEIFSKNMVRISFNKTSVVCFTNDLIGNTYEAVLLFIEWYNENK